MPKTTTPLSPLLRRRPQRAVEPKAPTRDAYGNPIEAKAPTKVPVLDYTDDELIDPHLGRL